MNQKGLANISLIVVIVAILVGALWISSKVMYELTDLSRVNLPSKETLRTVAESFVEVK